MNIIDTVSALIDEAIATNTSDIHCEPSSTGLRVRMRRDGQLQLVRTIPKELASAFINRLKVMAGMDIALSRIPQDGHCIFRYGESTVDIRFSTLPTILGEKLELRILNANKGLLSVDALAMPAWVKESLLGTLARGQGLFLVVGPTGSGKTTTLYALLQELNNTARNIITLEDPVEYHVPGITQVQVCPKAGLTFAAGLRAILRQDPDIILVGELRDTETAEIALRAALTGHLVLATLHTRDAIEAVVRLHDMGIPAYVIASALRGVLAQRLIPLKNERGRRALFEYFPLASKIQETIQERVRYNELRAVVNDDEWWPFTRSAAQFMQDGLATKAALLEFLPPERSTVKPCWKNIKSSNVSPSSLMSRTCSIPPVTCTAVK